MAGAPPVSANRDPRRVYPDRFEEDGSDPLERTHSDRERVIEGEILEPRSRPVDNRATVTGQRPRPAEVLRAMSSEEGAIRMFDRAYRRGVQLSTFLETEDPSEGYDDGLDAFGRLLRTADLRIASNESRGFWADTWETFVETPHGRALAYEWAIRTARTVQLGRPFNTRPDSGWVQSGGSVPGAGQRALYASQDQVPGSILFPYVSAAQARYQQIAPTIPLNEIVALTTPIVGDSYRAFYLTQDAAAQRFVRVGQGDEVPVSKLVGADHPIRLHKYGRALDATYEQLRRQRIDLVGLHIARIAIQAEIDRVAAGITTMVSGDGNTGTAATNFNLSSLDAAAVLPNPTIKAYLTFKLKFLNPYVMTHVLVQGDVGVALQLLNTGTANIPLARIQVPLGLGEFTIINPQLADRVRFGVTADAPATTVLGFDSRFALERVVEIGSDITEVDRFVSRQTNRIVISVVEGFITLDLFATKTLTLNA